MTSTPKARIATFLPGLLPCGSTTDLRAEQRPRVLGRRWYPSTHEFGRVRQLISTEGHVGSLASTLRLTLTVMSDADQLRLPPSPELVARARAYRESGGSPAPANLDPTKLEADRLALIEHRATFDEVLARHGAVAQPQLLRPWSRWITPDFEPRRYDTHFYVALVPAQDARFVGGEADAAQWVAPEFAVGAQKSGAWLLMPPTEWTLRELSTFTSAADVFAAGNRRDLTPVRVRIDLDSEPPRWVVIDP